MNTLSTNQRAAAIASAAAAWAVSKVGCAYSQARRTEKKGFDCSSLVARAYIAQNMKWFYGGPIPISCDEVYDDHFELIWPGTYEDIGKRLGGEEVIAKATQPGDIQFLRTSASSRPNQITHVALVADKKTIVHARGKAYGVVTSPIDLYKGKVCAVSRYNPVCPLRKGMKGFRTLALQQALRSAGYAVTTDGNYGVKTVEAVKKYQQAQSFQPTGIADNVTLAKLKLLEATPAADGAQIIVTGDSVNIRTGPGKEYPISRIARVGDSFFMVPIHDWLPIIVDDTILWISAKYAQNTQQA